MADQDYKKRYKSDSYYKDEYEFKELNAKFLKRPAAVLIRKPLISTAAMSDVLTRLLRNYVPPKYIDGYKVPPMSGGLATRAFLNVYAKGIIEGSGTMEFVPSWSDGAASGYFVPKKDSETKYSLSHAISLRWDQTIVLSNTVPQEVIEKAADYAFETKGYMDNTVYEQVSGANNNRAILGIPNDYTYSKSKIYIPVQRHIKAVGGDIARIENGYEVTITLLSKYDHDCLAPDANGVTTSKVLKAHRYLFKDGKLPYCDLNPVVIYDPSMKNKLNKAEKQIVKDTFGGRLPYNQVIGYRWHFTMPSDTDDGFIYIIENTNKPTDPTRTLFEKAAVDTEMSFSNLYTRLEAIARAIKNSGSMYLSKYPKKQQPRDDLYNAVLRLLENHNNKANSEYKERDRRSIQNALGVLTAAADRLEEELRAEPSLRKTGAAMMAQELKEPDNWMEYLGKLFRDTSAQAGAGGGTTAADVAAVNYTVGTVIDHITKKDQTEEYTDPGDAVNKAIIKDPAEYQKLVDEIAKELSVEEKLAPEFYLLRKFRDAIDDYNTTVNDDVASTYYFIKRNHFGLVPFFPISNSAFIERSAERRSLFIANKSVNYVEGDNPTRMSEGDFKIRYYAVLLKMIEAKINKYMPFIESGIMHFPLLGVFNACRKISNGPDVLSLSMGHKLNFIKQCEILLFGATSGLYVTSCYSGSSSNSVKAPLWNAAPTQDDTDLLDQRVSERILQSSNNDVSAISVSRVVKGISRATLAIKNDHDKYSFERGDVLNRTEVCIEPMDTVFIYLPTFAGKLRQVFSGLVTKVSANNDEGYHMLNIQADCELKRLSVSRTNMKPSFNRDEACNEEITAFNVPQSMFASISQWMPFMFTQSLSYVFCMPRQTKTEKDYTQELWTETDSPQVVKVVTPVIPFDVSSSSGGSSKLVQRSDLDENNLSGTSSTGATKTVTVSNTRTNVYVGTHKFLTFGDNLYNYLWYKSCSRMPKEEKDLINAAQIDLINDYVETNVYGSGKHETPTPRKIRGAQPIFDFLKRGERCSYRVYKQRFSGISGLAELAGVLEVPEEVNVIDSNGKTHKEIQYKEVPVVEDREIAADIIGTSQPAYLMSSVNTSIQFSNWRTNFDIINETADKFNFCLYTDANGIVRFTPYNFDLTMLNTRAFSQPIDSYCMLTYRTSKTVENDPNPLILRRQYISRYTKQTDDRAIVNWIRLTGSFIIGKNALQQALVTDPYLIKKFGVREGRQRNILGLSSQQALQLYGISWMDRQNKRYRSATIAGLFDANMEVNRPYYVPHDEIIYLAESLNIEYMAGGSCTYTMGASYGKQPILDLRPYVHYAAYPKPRAYLRGDIVPELDRLFSVENRITPYVYAQYRRLFETCTKAISSATSKYTKITGSGGVSTLPTDICDCETGEEITYDVTQFTDEDMAALKEADNALSSARDRLLQACSICCYNGLLWDNVSGISFEELIYNYGWLLQGKNIASFLVSTNIKDKVQESLQSLLKAAQTSGGVEINEATKIAISQYFENMIAISDPNATPEFLMKKKYSFGDLKIEGLVEVGKPQISVTQAKGVVQQQV